MDGNENAEWGMPLFCGCGIKAEPGSDGPHHKMHCDLRFAVQCLQMAPPTAVAYLETPTGGPLKLIVNLRQAREKALWAVLLQDEAKPRVMSGDAKVFVTDLPGVLGKTMNEVLAECQATLQSKSKTP